MYKIGDKIIHQQEGACYIKEFTQLRMESEDREYYVLEPICDRKSKLYISKQKNHEKRMRLALSQKEIKELERIADSTDLDWIMDSKKRYQTYQKTISGFDFLEVLLVLKNLTVQNAKKPLCSKDNQLFRAAQKLICSEVSIVIDKDYELVTRKVEQVLSSETVCGGILFMLDTFYDSCTC